MITNNDLQQAFRPIKETDELLSLTNEGMYNFAKKLDSFIDMLKEEKRQPIKSPEKYTEVLLRLGLSIEAAILYREESRIYRNINDKRNSIRYLYMFFQTLLGNIYIPPVFEQLKKLIPTLENTILGPLFYYILGFTYHFHLFSYQDAFAAYEKALKLLSNSNKKEFNKLKLGKYEDMQLLLLSNMFDATVRQMYLEGKSEELKERASTLFERIKKIEKDKIFFAINEIEFLLASDLTARAKNMLLDLDKKISQNKNKQALLPLIYRTWALYSWKREDKGATVNHFKNALNAAIQTQNILREKEIIDTIIVVLAMQTPYINVFSSEGKELLDYLLSKLLAKDWYMGEDHSRGVAELSKRIALNYNRTTGAYLDTDKIYLAGLLHDAGKLYIPWYILNKPVKPVDVESDCLRYHPSYGGIIVRVFGLDEYAKYVEEHHERLDGSGYPAGISSPHIISQIIGVADEFVAATSLTRKFQRPKDKNTVVREMDAMSGIKFAPEVIEALKMSV